jgi:hypothetical protein
VADRPGDKPGKTDENRLKTAFPDVASVAAVAADSNEGVRKQRKQR